MPKIPKLDNQGGLKSLSLPVQTQTSTRFQEGFGRAISGIGESLQQTGKAMLEKRKQAKDFEYNLEARSQLRNELQEFDASVAKFKAEDGTLNVPEDSEDLSMARFNGMSYDDATAQFIQERYEAIQSNAPSEEAQKSFVSGTINLVDNRILSARMNAAKDRRQYQMGLIDKQADSLARDVSLTPSPLVAGEAIQEMEESVAQGVGIHFDEATANQIKKVKSEQITLSMYQGMLNNDNPESAVALLKDKENPFNENLDPRAFQGLLAKAERGLEIKRDRQVNELNEEINNTEKAATILAQPVSPETIKNFKERANVLIADKDQRKIIETKLDAMEGVADVMRFAPDASTQELNQRLQEVREKGNAARQAMAKDGINKASKDIIRNAQVSQMIEQGIASHLKQRREDPALYFRKNAPYFDFDVETALAGNTKIRDSLQANEIEARRMGMPFRATTNAERQVLAAQLNQIITPSENISQEQRVQLMENLETSYGKYFPKMMQEVEAQDKSLIGLSMVTHFDDPVTKKALMASFYQKEQNEKVFKERFPKASEREELKIDLNAELNDFYHAISQSRPENLSESQAELAMRETAQNLLMANTLSARNGEDAVQKTVDQIKSEWHVLAGKNRNVIVPKKSLPDGVDLDRLESQMDRLMTMQGLDKAGLFVETGFEKTLTDLRTDLIESGMELNFDLDLSNKGQQRRFARQIAESAFVVSNKEQNGVIFYIETPMGVERLEKPDGQAFEMTFEKIMKLDLDAPAPDVRENSLSGL